MQYQTQMALAFNSINANKIPAHWHRKEGAMGAITSAILAKIGTFTRQGWTSNLSEATFKKFQKEGIPVSEKQVQKLNNAEKV